MLKKLVFMKMEILKKKTRFISILIISLLFASCSSDLDITKFTDEEISEKFSYSDDGVLYFKKKLYTGKIIKYNYIGGELEFELNYLDAMVLITSMYFLASIIPTISIFDVIIKGSVAVFVFSYANIDELHMLSIITLMWILNFAIPSILGSYYVLKFKLPKISI